MCFRLLMSMLFFVLYRKDDNKSYCCQGVCIQVNDVVGLKQK
ncbi:hypothetical protein HKBW3S34_00113 [Candidatus Hakubella thermalkaliphila]|uniref:Uncharacterized protein n=1 Tax=Candidatus Hakubella thermalkaliphila TaxID=2754717 RepID=A0A6V8PC42_9ACTN|nr:hypothetical protein HKBW3S34_00113 [Candidatus Hakubella thermalkaliphila]